MYVDARAADVPLASEEVPVVCNSLKTTVCFSVLLLVMLTALIVAPDAGAATRRILLVGDSWPMFMWDGLGLWTGRAFQDSLIDKGYGQWEELGGCTSIGTSQATEWASNSPTICGGSSVGRLDVVRETLLDNPTIDIVHVSLGGNDYGRGYYEGLIQYVPYAMQTIVFSGTPTGGSYTLSFRGATTAPIAYNATAAQVEAALAALSTVGAGNVEVIDAEGYPRYFCTFKGALANLSQPMMTVDATLLTGCSMHLTGVRFDHGWKKEWGINSPAELLFFDGVCSQIRVTIEACLNARPDIRVALCDYDYMYTTRDDATVEETNVTGMRLGMRKFLLMQELSATPQYHNRCFYINPAGVAQWTFGYPDPLPEGQSRIYGPLGTAGTGGTIDKPKSNLKKWGISIPELGGDITYVSPVSSMLFDWGTDLGQAIHFNKYGYKALADYCVDEFYGEWLDLPRVLSVTRSTMSPLNPGQSFNPTGLNTVSFKVVFSEPVTGVDEGDFDAIGGSGLSHPTIKGVSEGKDGATYEVQVDTGSGDGSLTIRVKDNGSIKDAQGNDLEGDIDGSFTFAESYTVTRSVKLPVLAWPAALALLGMGLFGLRRKP